MGQKVNPYRLFSTFPYQNHNLPPVRLWSLYHHHPHNPIWFTCIQQNPQILCQKLWNLSLQTDLEHQVTQGYSQKYHKKSTCHFESCLLDWYGVLNCNVLSDFLFVKSWSQQDSNIWQDHYKRTVDLHWKKWRDCKGKDCQGY